MIGGLAPVTSYPSREPVPAGSVMFLGDIHYGRGAWATTRLTYARADLLCLDLDLLVQVGDMTENGLTAEDTAVLPYLAGLNANTVRTIVGNHDVQPPRTAAAAATAWGLPGTKDWTFDMGSFLVIGVSQEGPADPLGGNGSDPSVTLSQTTIDWLAAQLDAATKECWIVCHAPLGGSAITGNPQFYATPTATIKAMLNTRPAATCWFSGHTHSSFEDTGVTHAFSVGSRNIVNANASAVAYVNPGDDPGDPSMGLLATYRPGGVDLRVRNFTQSKYKPWPDGNQVMTLVAT